MTAAGLARRVRSLEERLGPVTTYPGGPVAEVERRAAAGEPGDAALVFAWVLSISNDVGRSPDPEATAREQLGALTEPARAILLSGSPPRAALERLRRMLRSRPGR